MRSEFKNQTFTVMATVSTYLNFNGNTEEAFTFYKSVFGGEFTDFRRFRDEAACAELAPDELDKIMHVSLPILGGHLLMATDSLASMGKINSAGNNFYICISTDSESQADTLFAKLAEGGTVEMPLEKAFWGAYFGCVADKFGVQWMLNYDYNQVQ